MVNLPESLIPRYRRHSGHSQLRFYIDTTFLCFRRLCSTSGGEVNLIFNYREVEITLVEPWKTYAPCLNTLPWLGNLTKLTINSWNWYLYPFYIFDQYSTFRCHVKDVCTAVNKNFITTINVQPLFYRMFNYWH